MYAGKMNQKEAVYSAVMQVLREHGIRVGDGAAVNKHMTRELRAEVNGILFQGFKANKIELDTEFNTDQKLKEYVSGLQSNWLRKDTRLNGGGKYVPKNPGSKANSGDAQLKSLRALLSTVQSPKEKAEIQGYIEKRQAEIQAAKTKVSVDFSVLPPALAQRYASRAG